MSQVLDILQKVCELNSTSAIIPLTRKIFVVYYIMHFAKGMFISIFLTGLVLITAFWGDISFYSTGVKHIYKHCSATKIMEDVVKVISPRGVHHVNEITLNITQSGNLRRADFSCDKIDYNLLEKYLYYTGKYRLRVVLEAGSFSHIIKENILWPRQPKYPKYYNKNINIDKIINFLAFEAKEDIIAIVDFDSGLIKKKTGDQGLFSLGEVI